MTNRNSVAARVAAQKAAHPEMFCRTAKCLWRTGGLHGTPCQRHAVVVEAPLVDCVDCKGRGWNHTPGCDGPDGCGCLNRERCEACKGDGLREVA